MSDFNSDAGQANPEAAPAAHPRHNVGIIRLPSDENLGQPANLIALSFCLRLVCKKRKLSRREVPNWMADMIYGFKGQVFDANGHPIDLTTVDIDAAFGEDGSFRWIGTFLNFVERPPKQRAQKRILLRLRLLTIALTVQGVDFPV